jgi:hypothetical protein
MEFISRLLWELFLKELLLLAAMVVLRGIRHMAAAVVAQERQERVKTVAKDLQVILLAYTSFMVPAVVAAVTRG